MVLDNVMSLFPSSTSTMNNGNVIRPYVQLVDRNNGAKSLHVTSSRELFDNFLRVGSSKASYFHKQVGENEDTDAHKRRYFLENCRKRVTVLSNLQNPSNERAAGAWSLYTSLCWTNQLMAPGGGLRETLLDVEAE